jgi:uncharacterized tellurite resistance protein B-like protein
VNAQGEEGRLDPQRKQRAADQLKTSIVEALEEFLEAYLAEPSDADGHDLSEQRMRLATAVLIVQITRSDFEISEDERRAVIEAVQHALGLGAEESEQIARFAGVQAERAPRLHDYAQIVDERCTLEQKRRILEALWRVAFADAEILAHEEYLVRKIAELLHLSTADLIEAKIKAREAFR